MASELPLWSSHDSLIIRNSWKLFHLVRMRQIYILAIYVGKGRQVNKRYSSCYMYFMKSFVAISQVSPAMSIPCTCILYQYDCELGIVVR